MGVGFGDLFGEVAETLQNVDQEFGSVSAESSALLRALAFQRMDGARDKLYKIENELSQRERLLLSELEQLDPTSGGKPGSVPRIAGADRP